MEVIGANLAYTFHMQPSEIESFNEDDFLRWSKQAERIKKELKAQTRNY